MKLFGHTKQNLEIDSSGPSELGEVTLVANFDELRKIAEFLSQAAEEIETQGRDWEHEHLSDRHPEFAGSPSFVVFNAEARE